MSADLRSSARFAVLAGALLLGAFLRLRGIADLPLFGDEHHTLLAADKGYGEILTTFDGEGSHVPLPLLQRLSLDILGPGVLPFRLVAIVPGLLTLLLAYPLLRGFFGRDAAALATALLAINPMHVYYSRFARGYALALLLALLLGWALWSVLDPGRRGRRTWGILIASATLLPWVHLSALGFVVALALTGIGLATRESRAIALRLFGAFAVAGVIVALLFLPVVGQVLSYFREMQAEDPPLSWLGVPTLIAGSAAAAWAWMGLGALGVVLLLRTHRNAVLLSVAALAGPLALLLATNPKGMDYAWARYILSASPFLMALVAAAFVHVVARVARRSEDAVAPLALTAGALLCVAQHATGPLAGLAPRGGSFSNSYLAMHELPAFDEPFLGAPAFYVTLAADPATRIIEAMPLLTRSALLYRNYALIHGKQVVIGWTGPRPRGLQRGPYRDVLEVGPEDADYLVLHRDQTVEVPDYWRFVFLDVWPRKRVDADETFMRRHEEIHGGNMVGEERTAPVASALRERLGPAFYKDDRILVWKLAP